MGLFDKIFGSYSDRELKRIYPIADAVEKLDGKFTAMSDEELKGCTAQFKARLAGGETLDDILPEAFAAVREAAWRVLGMKPIYSATAVEGHFGVADRPWEQTDLVPVLKELAGI